MSSLMGKSMMDLDSIWVTPKVKDFEYPAGHPADPIEVIIFGELYLVEVETHLLDNITYSVLDPPAFRAHTKSVPRVWMPSPPLFSTRLRTRPSRLPFEDTRYRYIPHQRLPRLLAPRGHPSDSQKPGSRIPHFVSSILGFLNSTGPYRSKKSKKRPSYPRLLGRSGTGTLLRRRRTYPWHRQYHNTQ